jgi:hypothetical protein
LYYWLENQTILLLNSVQFLENVGVNGRYQSNFGKTVETVDT